MERRILLLEFLILLSGLHLSAQTLKNIHRHNQPVLHIPTHLIDRVETAEINGERVLKVIQLNGYVSQIPVSQIDSITHSEGQALDPAQLGNLRTASVMGVVTGPTGAPEMNAIVRSPYGGEETRTDPNGVFFLNNILVYDKLGYITITKPGFHQGSRSFLPLEQGRNRVNIQLLRMASSGTFIAASGGTVTSGLLQLSFPANAIQLNGQPYSGTVKVYAQALDPTSNEMFDQMPGELLGGMNDSLKLLHSFGMASIELRDANMNELQLTNGISATLTFSIPTSLQADAPETIDWWSFDEVQGYWKHEGEAIKQDSQYVGQASHFSWWNCDKPQNFNDIYGTVNSVGGAPVSDAQVNVVTQTLGTGVTYTNSDGVFSGRVPKNQQLTLKVYLTCSTNNELVLAHTESIISETSPISASYLVELIGYFPITGVVVNCQNQPVTSGYVLLEPHVLITNESGQFTIQSCEVGENIIGAFDTTIPDSIKASELDTFQVGLQGVDLGVLQACNEIFETVVDIDGNVYPSVKIGTQQWMAENLRTSRFRNGIEIPLRVGAHVDIADTSNYRWEYTYDNLSVQEQGFLYTAYVAMDTSGVCPIGWHVPSDSDFAELELFIGIPVESIYTLGNRGNANNVARKLKVPNYWGGDYEMAAIEPFNTNSTFFCAMPSGTIWSSQGWTLMGAGGSLGLWTTTDASTQGSNITRYISASSTGVLRSANEKRIGYSIRCVKD